MISTAAAVNGIRNSWFRKWSAGYSWSVQRKEDARSIPDSRSSVLFVCWANVCRSPAAKSVFDRYLACCNRLKEFRTDSAGVVVDDPFIRPCIQMRKAAQYRGYCLKEKARRILRTDLIKFDLVVAMDRRVLNEIGMLHVAPLAEVRLLGEFLPVDQPMEVPDPMNRSMATCNRVFDLLEMACPGVASLMTRIGREQKSETRRYRQSTAARTGLA